MRKTDQNRRPHKAGGNGMNSGGRQNDRSNKPSGSRANRSSSRKQSVASAQAWLSSPHILSSHLPTGERQHLGNNSKKHKNRNGNGQPDSFSKGRENGHRKDKQRHPQKSHRPNNRNNNRQSSAAHPKDEHQGKNSLLAEIDPFELFCAYHLGIEPNNGYKPANINQVSQRFGVDPATIRQATQKYGFDPESMLNKDFDLALAQLDIQVAPEGVSKIELAKGLYEEFLNASVLKRDWNKILQEDAKENRKVFGG
ncbi:MAG: hypothetical protein VYC17_00795 [Nitrospinota bacterium]|nr:hypothetical protein [Nitrospinota bacterium]